MPLPYGTVLRPVPGLVVRGRALLGGVPLRLLTLTPAGLAAAHALLAGEPAETDAARLLGRRLVDAGHARPYPPAGERPPVTVVVPVRDRDVSACLEALGDRDPVIVVDDGSAVPVTVDRAHVRVLRHARSRGPAAARNTGLDAATTELVACVDSDVLVPPGWLDRLLPHLADPAVAAVAPRVRACPEPTTLGRYLRGRSPLDLGPDDVPVRPDSPVAYVPSAALLLRRGRARFDEHLRVGEDVDLVWRLVEGGSTVRYVPAVEVLHREPVTWRAALRRRYTYGRSAAPLASRHPDALTHLRAAPLPLAAAVALVAAPPSAAVATAAAATAALALRTHRRLRPAGLGRRDAAALAGAATGQAVVGLGRWLTVAAGPVAAAAALRRPRLAAVLAVPLLLDYRSRRPPLDPVRFCTAALVDDLAYGAGVWTGVLGARDLRALLPRMGVRAVRPDG